MRAFRHCRGLPALVRSCGYGYMRKEGQVQCETPTVNLSLYHTQPERHNQPQTLDRLTKDWTRHRSAGLRHGIRSSEYSQRHRSAGLRHGDVLDPTQSPVGVRTEIDQPESGRAPPQSKTWRKHDAPRPSRRVVEAPSPRLRRPEVRAPPRRIGCGLRGRRETGYFSLEADPHSSSLQARRRPTINHQPSSLTRASPR